MQPFATLLTHKFEYSACSKARVLDRITGAVGEGNFRMRPVPTSRALTVLTSRGKGPVQHILPPPGEEGAHSRGSREGGQCPDRGEKCRREGSGCRQRHSCPAQLRGLVREPRAAGKEGRPWGPWAWEPGFHVSAAELWFPLPCPLWKGHYPFPPALYPKLQGGLCSGGRWPGVQKDPS